MFLCVFHFLSSTSTLVCWFDLLLQPFYSLQPFEPVELPDFQRTVIESPERTAKESVEVIADEPDMPPGKYTWEKTPAPKSLTEEKPLVIPKIKVCEF